MAKWNGMNWITPQKRLAIYLRDGLCCVYCGATVENGATMSLDHLIPRSKNGSNEAKNLITCCKACNTRRHNRPLTVWINICAEFNCVSPDKIHRDVRRLRSRKLKKYVAVAKNIITERGTVAKALDDMPEIL